MADDSHQGVPGDAREARAADGAQSDERAQVRPRSGDADPRDRSDGSASAGEADGETSAADATDGANPAAGRNEPGSSGVVSAQVADREALLFLSDPSAVTRIPAPEGETSIVMDSAAFVFKTLDPLEQEGTVDDVAAGKRYVPGLVPLAPVTFTAFFLNCASLVSSMLFSLQYVGRYLLAFSVFHGVIFGNLYTYYVAYRTRRRFLALRQVVFIVGLVAFVDWMMWEMIHYPGEEVAARARLSSLYATYLWVGIGLNASIAALVTLHWAILGRGTHTVPLAAGRPKPRRER